MTPASPGTRLTALTVLNNLMNELKSQRNIKMDKTSCLRYLQF